MGRRGIRGRRKTFGLDDHGEIDGFGADVGTCRISGIFIVWAFYGGVRGAVWGGKAIVGVWVVLNDGFRRTSSFWVEGEFRTNLPMGQQYRGKIFL